MPTPDEMPIDEAVARVKLLFRLFCLDAICGSRSMRKHAVGDAAALRTLLAEVQRLTRQPHP